MINISEDDRKEIKIYGYYNPYARWLGLGLTILALLFLTLKNIAKVNWTNEFFNKLLKKEKLK